MMKEITKMIHARIKIKNNQKRMEQSVKKQQCAFAI